MEKIRFDNVVPHVFSQQRGLQSDVWGTDISFERGHLYLVEAGSGKGKSTFCSYVVGYRHDYDGRVTFDERDTRDFKVADWVRVRRKHISHLFQELRLFPELTAWENVQVKNALTHHADGKRVKDWFQRLGIADKMNAKAGLMSFGQQQRVAMIRALVQPFDFLLADEPISHLDDENARIMGEIMLEEAQAQGAGVIVTSIGKHIDLNYERTVRL